MATGEPWGTDFQTNALLAGGSALLTPRGQGGGFAALGPALLNAQKDYQQSQLSKMFKDAQVESLRAAAEERHGKAAQAKYQRDLRQKLMLEQAGITLPQEAPSAGSALYGVGEEPMPGPDNRAAIAAMPTGGDGRGSMVPNAGGGSYARTIPGQQAGQQAAQSSNPRLKLMQYLDAGFSPEMAKQLADPDYGKKGPVTLKSGELVLDPNNGYKQLAINPKEAEQSGIAKLIGEQSKLAPGSPGWKIYADAIKKQTTHQPPASTSVTVNAEKDLAGQVGDIMKGERTKVDGSVRMFNAADQLERALDSGQVITGPGADAKTKALQIGKVLGITGKTSEEMLVNTRSVIKSLAQMSLESRKELAGQGTVTDSEAQAAQKAMSGDITDLTDSELRLIVGVTKRAAAVRAQQYADQVKAVPSALRPFYAVPGLESISDYKGLTKETAKSPTDYQDAARQELLRRRAGSK